MDLNSLLSSVAVVVALVSGGGLGLQRSRVAALKADLSDEKGRNASLRQDVADLKIANQEQATSIAKLRSDLEHAEALATGETHWVALDVRLEGHEKNVNRYANEILDLLRKIDGKNP